VALRLQPRRPVGPEIALGRVVQGRKREHHRPGDRQVGDVLGNRHPVLRRCESDAVQDAVSLGQQVLSSVGGMTLSDGGDHALGGVGEDRLGQVAGPQNW
jgi:hypothetical protein